MYISELIKDEYKEWEAGQIILISAPTGSGKSNFIFDRIWYTKRGRGLY